MIYLTATLTFKYISDLLYYAEGGKIGRWIFRLYEAEPNGEPTQCNQYEYKCLNWLSNTVMPTWWLQWSIPPCPCNLQQVQPNIIKLYMY